MGTITKDLGIATAYGYAVSKGYTGTEEEFATLMASYATVAEEAAESASEAAESASAAGTSATSAAESATSASVSATSAGTAASTATTKAGEASASASTASTAATTATTKASEATTAATNAANSATAAGNAQTAAETAQGKAEDAQTAAEAAQEAAEEAAASLVLDATLTQPNQAAEAKAVGDALVNKAPVIIASASGSIANFPDGAEDLPVKNLVVNIEPKQSGSGDPSPTNVRPITGWDGCEVVRAGKNLLDYSGTITPSSPEPPVTKTFSIKETCTFSFKASADYTNSDNYWLVRLGMYDGSYIYITPAAGQTVSRTINATQANPLVSAYIRRSGVTTGSVGELQIELGSTATAYEPYSGSTYPISWVTTSGMVYGGRVNVTTGELVVDRAMVDLGTLTWTMNDTNIFGTSGLNSVIKAAPSNYTAGNLTSSRYKSISYASLNAHNVGIAVNVTGTVRVCDLSYSDAATFTTAMSGVQLVYELATPLTYQLTPVQVRTLLGQNNVWADCGDTEVEYRADTKLYIERLTEPTEDDMIADHAIASGTFFMIGNNLYRATASIASGATITVGTNATKLSLADALNALS